MLTIRCLAISALFLSPLLGQPMNLIPPSAPRGARVIVVGSGLNAVAVYFPAVSGRVAAPIISASPSLIELSVPSSAISGNVVVEINGAVAARFPFAVAPDPAFTKVATLAASEKAHDIFKQPASVAVSRADGKIYVADKMHDQVKVLDARGNVVAAIGGFNDPQGVAIDSRRGFVYASDKNAIRRINADGSLLTVATGLNNPSRLAVGQDGSLFVGDNYAIRRIATDGSISAIGAEFKDPSAIAVSDSGILYIADSGNNRIRKFENGVMTTIGSDFKSPTGVAVDDAGDVIVADTGNNSLKKITATTTLTIAGAKKEGFVDGDPAAARFKQPAGIDAAGAIFIADSMNDAVRAMYVQLAFSDLYPRSGSPKGGTEVRLFGTGFVPGATAVSFGALPATVRFISSTEIIATSPASAAGSVDVTITTPAGSATRKQAFRFQQPFVSIAVTPSNASIAPGDNIQFTAMGDGATDITPLVTWSSSPQVIASISTSGLAHGIAAGTATITARLDDLLGSTTLTVAAPEPVPPDPATIASKIDPTAIGMFVDEIRFLFSGPNAIQTGVAPGAIDDARAAVIRGRTITNAGAPLAAVHISVLNHPEFGQTLSRADGKFDLVMNGGGAVTLQFLKSSYLAVQRTVPMKWEQQTTIADIALVKLDSQVTTLMSGAAANQVARASEVNDADGRRRATLVVPAATSAALILRDGTSQPMPSLHVRATEFTVGANGPKSMPALLPPSTGYTYCVELSADEAIAAGATTVQFSKPLAFYVENFLNAPVGTAVPAGYYDRDHASWKASSNGVVLKILSVVNGSATVDLTGDGVADDFDAAELQTLGSVYAAGQTLWRLPVTHFTPYDANYSAMLAAGATTPSGSAYGISAPEKCDRCGDKAANSVVNAFTQTVRESIPIVGTPYDLQSASSRNARTQYKATINLGANVPQAATRIELSVGIAGQFKTLTLPPQPNLTYDFVWDGNDAYGRPVQGAREASITIGYVYPITYGTNSGVITGPLWGIVPDIPLTSTRARSGSEASLTQTLTLNLGHIDMSAASLGGWSLSPQRFYDPHGSTIYDGDGQQRSSDPDQTHRMAVTTLAGDTSCCFSGDGGPATKASLDFPVFIAAAPDGSVYLWSPDGRIRKVDSKGVISTVLGPGTTSPSGGSLAVGPDGTLFIADFNAGRVSKLDASGLTTVAGGGTTNVAHPVNLPATQIQMSPGYIAAGSDGSLYIADDNRILRVTPDGLASYVYGVSALSVAVANDGTVYAADEDVVHRISPAGAHTIFAGSTDPLAPTLVDGAPAAGSNLPGIPGGMDVAPDGTLVLSLQSGEVIYGITADGIAHRLIGDRTIPKFALPMDGLLARGAPSAPSDVRVTPDGGIVFADQDLNLIRKATNVFPRSQRDDVVVPSADGSVAHIFRGGRHTQTVNATTGTVLLSLAYDANGALTSLTDADGNRTLIDRDAITSPGGQRTVLTTIAGKLAAVQNPAGETIRLEYGADGLLSQLTDARGGVHKYGYNADGLVTRDEGPDGGFISLVRSGIANSITVAATTAEGRVDTYHSNVAADTSDVRDVTAPDGTVSRSTTTDANTMTFTAEGATIRESTAPGRFGMRAPSFSSGTISAGGHTLTLSHTESVATAADNPLRVAQKSESATINGRRWTSSYDGTTRTTTLTSPLSRSQTSAIDDRGRLLSLSIPGFATSSIGYNAFGAIDRVQQDNRIARFAYDSKQQLASITDPLQRVVRFSYDAAGRVVAQTLPDQRVIGFSYDANGNIASITPPSRPAHAFAFTPSDLAAIYTPPTVPNAAATQYGYNRDRQLTSVLRPDGHSIGLLYDTAGRLTTVTVARGAYTYGYNASGQLASAASPEAAVSYAYNGPLLSSITSPAGSVSLGYDDQFRIASESAAGSTVAFGYDNDGLLTSAGALTLVRDPQNGRLTGTALGTITDTRIDDAFGDVTGYSAAASGSAIFTQQFKRDDGGRIFEKSETIANESHAFVYGYDPAGRLSTVTRDGVITTYIYDDASNRLPGVYDAQDRLVSMGNTTYAYTPAGELASKTDASGTTSYTYDELGNLLHVALPNGTAIDYIIDGENRRVGKKINGALVQQWIYADQRRIVAEIDASTRTRFVYGSRANVPDYMVRDGLTFRIIADHLESPRLVVNADTGVVFQRIDYDEFGNVVADSAPGFIPFGYAGGLYDGDTRLVRFGARDYDPSIGRWTLKDPLDFAGGDANLYGYVFADPINFTDPSGLAIERCFRPFTSPRALVLSMAAVAMFPAALAAQPPAPGVRAFLGHEYLYDTVTRQSKGFDPTENRQESGADLCYTIPEPLGQCVWNNFDRVAGPKEKYNLLTNNCQITINRTVSVCRGAISSSQHP